MSLVGALETVAARRSGRGIRLFHGDKETARITYDELYSDVGRLAGGLLEQGVVPGERVAVALPTSIDFPRAFFGILAAGAVPVPVPPPFRFASLEVHMRRIAIALRQSGITRILSNASLGGLLEPAMRDPDGAFTILDIARIQADSPVHQDPVHQDVDPDQPALVQYTSGTINDPKGVVLSHANLLANVESITAGLDITADDVCCTWLPLFHDMGLIGSLLGSVLNDAEILLLPPEDFLRDPGRWVRMISEFGGSITAAPNSGYLHTLRRVSPEAVRELDLSRWRLALNGAEAVDAGLLRRFAEHFAPAGFRESAFLPVYGLAEASLAVTFPPVGRPMKTVRVRRDLLGEGMVAFTSAGAEMARELVSVGTAVRNTAIRLVDDDGGALLTEEAVGEIEIRGAAVTSGYEANEPATRRTVRPDGWVATGDLGFLHDGELFVLGRKKEMVIVFGQNYYASDIEAIAGQVSNVEIHGTLAASVSFADGESLVLFVETREAAPAARAALVAEVRYAVSSALGVTPREVFLIRRGRLPRTSSGKLRRHGIEALYAECTAGPAESAAPAELAESAESAVTAFVTAGRDGGTAGEDGEDPAS